MSEESENLRMADRIGQQLGNYQLVQLLGQGGFAEVYLAEHLRLKTHAAIKVLYGQMNTQDIQNFTKEAQTVAALRHPHIISLFDFDVQGGIPFLVMDYAPKGSLGEQHPLPTTLSLPVVLSYVKQIGEALQFAHSQRFIHRDMKPENILVGRHNELLLSDFGIATITHTSTSIKTQAVVGTTLYMAPEQIIGKPCPASDQYALGIIVYRWLCGKLPFVGSIIEIVTQHLSAPPPPLHTYNAAVSPHVEQVVLRAIAKEPSQRFATIEDFVLALEQAYDDTVKKRPVRQIIAPTVPAQVMSSLQSTQISPRSNIKASSKGTPDRDQAYESLRKQVEAKCDVWGALVIRTEDDQVGKVIHVLSENDWISSSLKERAKHDSTVRRYVKPQNIKGQTIPTAIFKEVESGDYVVWIDINRPAFASINDEEATLVNLQDNVNSATETSTRQGSSISSPSALMLPTVTASNVIPSQLSQMSFEEEMLNTYIDSLAQETHFSSKRELAEQIRDFIEEHARFFNQPEQARKLLTVYDQAIQAASKGPQGEATYYGDARNILIKQKARCLTLFKRYEEVLDFYVQSLARETHFSSKRELAEQIRDFIEEHIKFFNQPEQTRKLVTICEQAIQAASKGPKGEATYYGDARNILIKQKARCLKWLNDHLNDH